MTKEELTKEQQIEKLSKLLAEKEEELARYVGYTKISLEGLIKGYMNLVNLTNERNLDLDHMQLIDNLFPLIIPVVLYMDTIAGKSILPKGIVEFKQRFIKEVDNTHFHERHKLTKYSTPVARYIGACIPTINCSIYNNDN